MLYVVDCKNAQMHTLAGNLTKITGIDRPHKNDLRVLIEHSAQENLEGLTSWIMNNLSYAGHKSKGVQTEKDFFKCIYKTQDDRIILKCVTTLSYDDQMGSLRYALGKLIDLTGLVDIQHFGYKYGGPNQDLFYTSYQQIGAQKSSLTTRENHVLSMVAAGKSSREIAQNLFNSVHTVDTHRRNIIEKMETNSAMDAYAKCKNLGWI